MKIFDILFKKIALDQTHVYYVTNYRNIIEKEGYNIK